MSQNTNVPSASEVLTGEMLEEAIVHQVEWYFSKENLAHDTFLLSKMDSQLYTPIKVISKFKMVKSLTSDENFLVEVLRKRSKKLEVDPSSSLLRPIVEIKRTTIVLHDVPNEVGEEDIRILFGSQYSTHISSIRKEMGNVWFVLFDDEEVTVDACGGLFGKVWPSGAQVRARVKSENLLRNLLNSLDISFSSIQQQNFSSVYPSNTPSFAGTARNSGPAPVASGVSANPVFIPDQSSVPSFYMDPNSSVYGAYVTDAFGNAAWIPPEQVQQMIPPQPMMIDESSLKVSMSQPADSMNNQVSKNSPMLTSTAAPVFYGPNAMLFPGTMPVSGGFMMPPSFAPPNSTSSQNSATLSATNPPSTSSTSSNAASGNNSNAGGRRGGRQNHDHTHSNRQPSHHGQSHSSQPNEHGNSRNQANPSHSQQGKNRRGNKGGRHGGHSGSSGSGNQNDRNRGTKAPVLGAQDFPPLPSASAGDQGGYNRPFRRYSLEEFAAIISRAPEKTIRRPMLPSDPELFLSEPNLTLELEKERPSSSGDFVARPSFAEAALRMQASDASVRRIPDLSSIQQLPSEVASFVFPSKPESSSESSVSSNKKDESSQGSSANVSKPKASANDSLKSSVSSETSSDSRSGSGRQAWKSSSSEKNVNSDGFTNIDDPSENRGGSRRRGKGRSGKSATNESVKDSTPTNKSSDEKQSSADALVEQNVVTSSSSSSSSKSSSGSWADRVKNQKSQ